MNKLDFFVNEYDERGWKEYANSFEYVNVSLDGIPQDIVNAVLTILGEDTGAKWLNTPLKVFDGQTAIKILETERGEDALKAYIMRLPN
jgi:hypothetical protein